MNRSTTLQTAIAAALFASLALAGCKKDADNVAAPNAPADTIPPATTPPATTEPTPMEGTTPMDTGTATTPAGTGLLTVTTIDLGNTVGTDNRVSAPSTTFASNDTIHASVATDGANAGNLTARWTFQDGQVIDTQDKSVAAGPQVTEFSVSKPDGWPTGSYKLEILSDGNVVQTREFEVK